MTQEYKRVFSGIQPTGNLHIGNYLGAVQQWVRTQENSDAIFCIVDLHAITVEHDAQTLAHNTFELVRTCIAAGINPQQSTLFVQSHVSAHAELMWILNTIARMGDMEKMTQFKDKSGTEGAERSSVGLFSYPILMAADILLYDAEVVPVGEDQVQHVELARTIARRFNKRYGDTFAVPKAQLGSTGARIMGLDDPAKKMSKSAPSVYNYIALSDDLSLAHKKIMKAVTDSGTDITYTENRPALHNLINIYSLLSEENPDSIVGQYEGKGFGDFKKGLSDVVVKFLTDFQSKMSAVSDVEVERILVRGQAQASDRAQKKMAVVKERVGFLK